MLRILQSLEQLNQVTIQHSGVPPYTEQVAENFSNRVCNSMMDLFVGYDKRALAISSHNYTTLDTIWRDAAHNVTYGLDKLSTHIP
jgi:hypothetical protein